MKRVFYCLVCLLIPSLAHAQSPVFVLNARDYFERPGVNVMVFDDFYPEGHQGGISIIQNGVRVATNGDLLLSPTLGQWSPVPKPGQRVVDRKSNSISITMTYPDSSKNHRGYNPISYPDLYFHYTIRVQPQGESMHVTVDLDRPLPRAFIGKVGFNIELYPGDLFGRSWYMDKESGIFPRQADGPVQLDDQGEVQPVHTPPEPGSPLRPRAMPSAW